MTDLQVSDGSKPPLAVRAVERASKLLAGRGSTRRRFLYRTAVIGSAIAADPLGYVMKPGTAYASVCGSGNSCSAGWSVFCCTINNGANTCPDNSYVAGWWKVDSSAFCLGSARYYIDCNRRPGKTCSCRCNSSGCDHRRVCCNVFRYGQCNTHIGGVTEVVCRLVTCTPPWVWSEACGRTVRTDNETRSHSSACLPRANPTRIEIKYQDMGLVGSILGAPTARERDGVRGGRKRRYENGTILWHENTGAHEVHGGISRYYHSLRADAGPLGYPKTDHRPTGDGKGTQVRFEYGSIYTHPQWPARAVLRRSDVRYRAIGGPTGRLGYPTSTTVDVADGLMTMFQRGAIYASPDTDAVEVMGRIFTVYRERGGPAKSRLGFPRRPATKTHDGRGVLQRFERGMIVGPSTSNVFAVDGPIFQRWLNNEQGAAGPWGYPRSHTKSVGSTGGFTTQFAGGTAFWKSGPGVHILKPGPVLKRYLAEGGPTGDFGFPTSDQFTVPETGFEQADFEGGFITYDPTTGQTQATRTAAAA